MNINYLAFAIPAFFVFVFIEYAVAVRLKKAHVFNYESSVSNVSIGIAERMLNLLIAGSFYELFVYVYQHYAVFSIPNEWWVWILMILATDLVWYWYHRLGHRVNFLWAAHIVHHQSEEFNLTVSARITTFQALIRGFFWCALPFAGFHPAMVVTILAIHGAYSFFTHTQVISRLGWLEHVLITPSLHGVHHASNEKYLDKNFGDVFVFWDKLFGTFQKEEEAPAYGLTHPIRSNSFLWQHFHYYFELAEAMNRVPGLKNKVSVLIGPPEMLDQEIRPALERRFFSEKPDPSYRFRFRGYINFQLCLCILLLTAFTALYPYFDALARSAIILFVLVSLINIGALLEQRRWIYYLECFRVLIVFGYLFLHFELPSLFILPIIGLVTLERVFSLSKLYDRYVLRYEKVPVYKPVSERRIT